MCGVEETGNKGKRTTDLCGVEPLEGGALFKNVEEKEIWHPVWKGKIDDEVNAWFIKTVVERIWNNEQVSSYILSSGCALTFIVESPKYSKWEGRNR
jgi:hypothetical protein